MKNKFQLFYFLISILFLLITVVYFLYARHYIISFLQYLRFTHILAAYFNIISVIFIAHIIAKRKSKIRVIITIVCTIVMDAFLSLICLGLNNYFFRNPYLKEITIDNSSKDLVCYVWEYDAFRARNLYVCLKINEFVYKKIPGAEFSVEPGFDPLESDAFLATYDVEQKLLTIQYKIDEECNWEIIETHIF